MRAAGVDKRITIVKAALIVIVAINFLAIVLTSSSLPLRGVAEQRSVDDNNIIQDDRHGRRRRLLTSSSWNEFFSNCTESDLTALSYDTSLLSIDGHTKYGAAYLASRGGGGSAKIGVLSSSSQDGSNTPTIEILHNKRDEEESISSRSGLRTRLNDDEARRRVLQWATHTGNDADPVYNALVDHDEAQITPTIITTIEEEKVRTALLLERLKAVVTMKQYLNEQFAKYDTLQQQQHHLTTSLTTNNNNGGMTQFSHTVGTTDKRQRLLIGSYAAWQWYDRNELASPKNLQLNKVSRINYAFFQTDTDGYIFGTDSWADANILYGPYKFNGVPEYLPEECKGGLGQDYGYNVYMQQQENNVATNSTGRRMRVLQQQGTTLAVDDDDLDNNNNEDSSSPPAKIITAECAFFEQCHRNFPKSKSCNVHKYTEGLIYQSHIAGTQIYPSIGGWTLSSNFPIVAASPNKRKRFAEECVGLIADYGFDGIDIDWEYPGYADHGGTVADRRNFNELLLEVRAALNEYQETSGRAPLGGGAYGLTAALPCGPANIDFLDVSFLSEVLDGMNVMSFDLHNEKDEKTGVNSPLYDQTWDDVPGLSVDGCVTNYRRAGAYPGKINIGVPFYGKTYAYATELNTYHSKTEGKGEGFADQKNWPQDLGTPVYYNIVDKLNNGTLVSVRHEPTKTQYAYFTDGSGLVSYDDQQSVCDKADYVNKELLGGLFFWEMTGDLMQNMDTPLIDMINRKLTETNFDCRLMAETETEAVKPLPPPAPKGEEQILYDPKNITVVPAIVDHLSMVESGLLVGTAKGALTRTVFVYRAWDGSLFPSYLYRFQDFLNALQTMSTEGVSGDSFYLGSGQAMTNTSEIGAGKDDANETSRLLIDDEEDADLNSTVVLENSLVYGLVNIAAFLAQAMTDSIIHDTCDELNIDHLDDDDTDRNGLDDGNDKFRFPISNACGQFGRNYETESCDKIDIKFDCKSQMNVEELANMESRGISRGHWGGAPGSFYCGPKEIYEETGFWDATTGREVQSLTTLNDNGKTDVQGCCWWGRGSTIMGTKGTCLYGKLNYHLGKAKASRDGEDSAMFPLVDFCNDPGQICTGSDSIPLRWISGMYHWMENVQKYDKDGYNYMDELIMYVNGDLKNTHFFQGAANIHVMGCHTDGCSSSVSVTDMDARLRAFEKVMLLFGLQFDSHAESEEKFEAYPGQQLPTPPPTVIASGSNSNTSSILPIEDLDRNETVYVPFKVFLTGVPNSTNMSEDELIMFDSIMYDLLFLRLGTVGVELDDLKIVEQTPIPVFSSMTNSSGNSDEEMQPMLELVLNTTLTYNPFPPPDGLRDWSLYMKSWVESFGNTVVEIFTSPKHPQHPQTNSIFFDDLIDVSAVNVPLFPTIAPTPVPEPVWVYPDTSTNKYIYIGIALAFLCLIGAFCYVFVRKLKEFRRLQSSLQHKKNLELFDDESFQHRGKKVASSCQLQSFSSSGSGSSSTSSSYSSHRSSNKSLTGSRIKERIKLARVKEEGSESSEDSSDIEKYKWVDRGQSHSLSTGMSSRPKSARGSSTGSYHSKRPQDSKRSSSGSSSNSKKSNGSIYSTNSVVRSAVASIASSAQQSKKCSQFDEIVDRVHANDPTLKNLVLDGRQKIEGHQYESDALWMALVDNSFVTRISLRCCNINDEDVASLSLALSENTCITHVCLEDNDITDDGAEYLLDILDSNATLEEINLFGNLVNISLLNEINALLNKRRRKSFHGDSDSESNSSWQRLGRFVQKVSRSSQEKAIVKTSISEIAQRILANDPTLTQLVLDNRQLGASASETEQLFEALSNNTYIKKVSLRNNAIDDSLAAALSLALADNIVISHVLLSGNLITSDGCEYLLGTLDSNTTLAYVELTGNLVDDRLMHELDSINASRNITGNASRNISGIASLNSTASSHRIDASRSQSFASSSQGSASTIPKSPISGAVSLHSSASSKRSRSSTKSNSSRRSSRGYASPTPKPPMHEVPEESDVDLAKRSAIMQIMKDTTIPWTEKNQRIMKIQQQFYIPKVEKQASQILLDRHRRTNENVDRNTSLESIIKRIRSNDPNLSTVDLNGRIIGRHSETALFEALARNSFVTSLSMVNCQINNVGAADLGHMLEQNTALTHINLEDNLITSNAALNFLTVLNEHNKTLLYLELKDNKIRLSCLIQIDKLLENRRKPFLLMENRKQAAMTSGVASNSHKSGTSSRKSGAGSRKSGAGSRESGGRSRESGSRSAAASETSKSATSK